MMKSRWHLWTSFAALCITVPATGAAHQISQAAGVGATVPFDFGRVDLRVGGAVHRLGSPVGPRTPFSFESTARVRLGSGGFWLGSGFEGVSQVDTQLARPLLRYGVWRSFNRIQVSVGATSRSARLGGRAASTWRDTLRVFDNPPRDSVPRQPPPPRDTGRLEMRTFSDSGVASRFATWSDIEGRLVWRLAALTMDAVVGARPRVLSFVPSFWGRLGAAYPVSDRFTVNAAAGAEPARIGIGLPASGFVSVALRVRPWRSTASADVVTPSAFVLQPTGAGEYRITYAATKASTVEVSGDFSGWQPVSLTKTPTGVWETTVALEPGTYHVNVRVDGGRWLPPPGLPQADDDFNGAVGVLVVR